MRIRRGSRARTLAVAGAGALLLSGCSTDSLIERGVSMIDGVDDVEIDREDGSVAIRNEDGGSFGIDVDEEEGTARLDTEDGSVVTGEASELPPEITAVFTPPPNFAVQGVSDVQTEDGRGLLAQGEITGDWAEVMDDVEAAVTAGPWDEVQRQVMQEGVMGTVVGNREDGRNLTASVIMDDDADTGVLSVMLVIPPEDAEPEDADGT